jgi:hypothetical protein
MTAAFHRSVLQQSRLQERVRWPPIQCEVSKPRPTKVLVVRFSEPRKYTDGYWRGWAHLEFVLSDWWFEVFYGNWNIPQEKRRIANTASSTQANVRVGKIALRRKRIFLDCWYMAYNRAIIMTCKKSQSNISGAHSQGLTAENGIYEEICHRLCQEKHGTWKT